MNNDAPNKPLGEVLRTQGAVHTFQQRLGLFDATMLIVGTMIGSGIFVVSADIARDVGSSGWLLAVWLATGVMTVIGGLCYAELAGMMPHAGGQYVFLREAFSPLSGFLYGWVCFLVIQTGSIAAVAVIFAKYLGELVPPASGKVIEQLVAVAVIVFLTLLNCRGIQEGKWVQNIFTVTKTLALIVLIVVGLTYAANPRAIEANLASPWEGIADTNRYHEVSGWLGQGFLVMLMVAGATMTGSLFAADAWNNITFTAGEVKNPRRNLPLSLALGTGSVIVLYLLANLAYLAVLPTRGDPALFQRVQQLDEQAKKLKNDGQADAAKTAEKTKEELLKDASTLDRGIAYASDDRVGTAVFQSASPRFGVTFMALAIMISTFGCVNGMILMGARLYYAMARDRLFFRHVGMLNRRGVPAVGLLLQGMWSIVLVFSGKYDELLDFIMFTALIFYALTIVGLFILRWRQPNLERPYRTFGYPVLPALYVLACLALCLAMLIVRPAYTWPGLLITLSGIPVYFFWRWRATPA